MARQKAGARKPGNGNGATIGYEASLWQMADKLRNNMDAAEYKHVVLGLLFLKYISDAFTERHDRLTLAVDDPNDDAFLPPTTPNRAAAVIGLREDPDEYRAHNIFWVPPEARWSHLAANARQPSIGRLVDDAMAAVERDNPSLKGVLPMNFARESLNKERLGQLVDLVGNIMIGDADSRAKDTLGRVYEYFLSQFASAEGKQGGEFYTPRCIVKTLVEMLEPWSGRVYDPCCGSAGMFVQSVEFIRAHARGAIRQAGARSAGVGGSRVSGSDISIFGQESNYTTWRLARMNLAIRGIDARIERGDTFKDDRHPDLRADFILANPPFNVSDWDGEHLRDDKRWKYGVPPAGNANFAWVQHMVYHLAPTGTAGFVLANGSMSSNQSGEGDIRKNLVESDVVDCMVALPGQLFYSTQIPACLWFLTRDKHGRGLRDRRGEILFIDARKLGRMADRTHRELTDADIARIADTYHAWRGEPVAAPGDVPVGLADGGGVGQGGGYQDIPGFCKSASLDEVRKHGHVLTPGRYVGAEAVEDDGIPFEEKMSVLVAKLRAQQAESARLDGEITQILQELGYGE
ncbi:MAG TPA: class I SAM-dependent DNA methyltransferase [Myxococcota bacterium]|nr:class I SAM-dependent DNA methyltransferase [Myxococcota bacterium]